MTPQERQLVDDLFDRLAKLETAPRDPDAVAAISQGLRRAPNAVYALVQTTLLQDEALKRANARIQELEGGEPEQPKSGGFLDSMRDAIFGPTPSRGSVPSVPPPDARSRPAWNTGQVMQQAQGPGQYGQPPYGQAPYGQAYGGPQQGPTGGGGSFLGTAAAAAAGVVGGGLLMNSIRGMMGGGHQAGFGDSASLGGGGRSPWTADQSGSDLARDAGINDIGSGGGHGGGDSRAGFFDQASNDYADHDEADMDADDFGGDGGDSDYA